MTPIGPNTAFVLTIFGLLAIYAEFVWPGARVARVIGPGVLGLGSALTGVYFLWLHAPSTLGLELLGAGAALFGLDAIVSSYFIAGIAGTAAIAVGFWKLIDGPHGIQAALAFPLCTVFGIATVFLNERAKRARRNKRADID